MTCTCVDVGGERWLIDPLLPPSDAAQVWDRLAERPPTAVAILLRDDLRNTWDDRHTTILRNGDTNGWYQRAGKV